MITEDYWTLQDHTYVATFAKSDGKYIKKLLERSRIDGRAWLDSIHWGIEKKWKGQYIDTNLMFEPIAVEYKKDKVTTEGMELFNQNIMLQSATRLSYMAVGNGIGITYPNQQILGSEVARASMDETGFANAEGLFLRWENIFDSLTPSFSCSEVGIFTSAVGGTMAARALLGQVVPHDYGNDWLYVQFFIATMSS